MVEIEEKVMVEIERIFVEDLLSKEKRFDEVIEVVEEWKWKAEESYKEGVIDQDTYIQHLWACDRILKIAKGKSNG